MRLTVGPLSPAVYWRRRAVVIGAGLLLLIVLLYSCNGMEKNNTANPQESPSPSSAVTEPSPGGSAFDPQTEAPPPAGDGGAESPVLPSEAPAPPPSVVPAGDEGTCTDAEISVTAVASPTSVRRGATVALVLKIKNVSGRTCSRDVGADLQELFVKAGAEKIWSSDTCGKAEGSDVQSFPPNHEKAYQVGWNGLDSTRCDNGLAAGEAPAAGSYQLLGRLGTKLSAPVKLTIVA